MGFLCVTIDLDEIDCYHAIHGLEPPDPQDAHVIYDRALDRAVDFFEEQGVKVTLFAVGRDLRENPRAARRLAGLAGSGHEVGNHTQNHRYDFTLLSAAEKEREVAEAEQAIQRATGRGPVGFRAPGYNNNMQVIEILGRRGYLYDSSVFPCPAYFAARAGAIGYKTLQGRRSASLVGDPRILTAPLGPYRIGEELWNSGDGLRELPITVASPARLPLLGTSLALMKRLPARLLAAAAARHAFVNIELHGIDFADAEADGLKEIAGLQPELRVPLLERMETFAAVIRAVVRKGHQPVTLAEAAERLFI